MKTWTSLLIGFCILVVVGCRANPSVVLLERQNRLLEDEIYRLRETVQDYQSGMRPVGGDARSDMERSETSPTEPETAAEPRFRLRRNSTSKRSKIAPAPAAIVTPQVELPGQAEPEGVIPETFRRPVGTPAGEAPPFDPDAIEDDSSSAGPNLLNPEDTAEAKSALSAQPVSLVEGFSKDDSQAVEQIVLNRLMTGGYDNDRTPGDEGVMVVIEPRDEHGRRLEAAADVSVVVLDPALTGEACRVARWDFSADETMRYFRGAKIERGLYLQCSWPEGLPKHNQLQLFVRYTTRDGRKLQAEQPIEIALAGERVARWNSTEAQNETGTQNEARTLNEAENQHKTVPVRSMSESGRRNLVLDPEAGLPESERSGDTASRANQSGIKRPTWSPNRQ